MEMATASWYTIGVVRGFRMQLCNSRQRYGTIPKLLHWLTVIFVLAAWVLGAFGNGVPLGGTLSGIPFLHVTAGLAVAVLVVVRIIWRVVNPPPPLEAASQRDGVAFIGALMHWALYSLLGATPVIGILLRFCRGDSLPLFGLFDVVSPWGYLPIAASVKGLHVLLANALVLCAALHAMAALVHHLILRDRTLERMLPGIAR